jgi:hypothetical protein
VGARARLRQSVGRKRPPTCLPQLIELGCNLTATDKQDLTAGPVSAHLRRQATPFGFGLVAIFSFEAVDLFFISKLGDAPLAAVSFTMPVIWLIYGIGIGFEAGAASCVSRAIGRRDHEQARRLTVYTMMLAAAVALVLALAGLSAIGPMFSLLGATPELMPMISITCRSGTGWRRWTWRCGPRWPRCGRAATRCSRARSLPPPRC